MLFILILLLFGNANTYAKKYSFSENLLDLETAPKSLEERLGCKERTPEDDIGWISDAVFSVSSELTHPAGACFQDSLSATTSSFIAFNDQILQSGKKEYKLESFFNDTGTSIGYKHGIPMIMRHDMKFEEKYAHTYCAALNLLSQATGGQTIKDCEKLSHQEISEMVMGDAAVLPGSSTTQRKAILQTSNAVKAGSSLVTLAVAGLALGALAAGTAGLALIPSLVVMGVLITATLATGVTDHIVGDRKAFLVHLERLNLPATVKEQFKTKFEEQLHSAEHNVDGAEWLDHQAKSVEFGSTLFDSTQTSFTTIGGGFLRHGADAVGAAGVALGAGVSAPLAAKGLYDAAHGARQLHQLGPDLAYKPDLDSASYLLAFEDSMEMLHNLSLEKSADDFRKYLIHLNAVYKHTKDRGQSAQLARQVSDLCERAIKVYRKMKKDGQEQFAASKKQLEKAVMVLRDEEMKNAKKILDGGKVLVESFGTATEGQRSLERVNQTLAAYGAHVTQEELADMALSSSCQGQSSGATPFKRCSGFFEVPRSDGKTLKVRLQYSWRPPYDYKDIPSAIRVDLSKEEKAKQLHQTRLVENGVEAIKRLCKPAGALESVSRLQCFGHHPGFAHSTKKSVDDVYRRISEKIVSNLDPRHCIKKGEEGKNYLKCVHIFPPDEKDPTQLLRSESTWDLDEAGRPHHLKTWNNSWQ